MKMNEKKNSFTIKNDEGQEITCDVLLTFDSDETKKSYILYTDNTTDEAGDIKTYAAIYDPTGNDNTLKPIETEEEWNIVENIFTSFQEKIGELGDIDEDVAEDIEE